MRSSLFVIPLCFVNLFAAISPDGARAVQRVNSMLDQLQIDPAFAAGNVAGREAEARAAVSRLRTAYNGCNMQLRMLIRDSREPEVLAARRRCDGVAATGEKLEAALRGAGASSQQNTALVYDFYNKFTRTAEGTQTALFRQYYLNLNPGASAPENVDEFRNMLATLTRIHEACQGPYKAIAQSTEPYGPNNMESAATWCGTAARREEIGRVLAMNTAAGPAKIWANEVVKLKEQLESREGFLTTDLTPIRRALFDREAMVQEAAGRHQALLDAAGVKDASGILGALQPSIDALMAEADRLAPRWKFPAGNPRDAAIEGYGRRAVAKVYPAAVVKASVMQTAAFSIRKNALGVPLDRTRDGFLLYKMPNEKYCRQQSFSYTEVYSGGGTYQKPDGVRLNYIRYQPCQ
jgi:hypothetical protein